MMISIRLSGICLMGAFASASMTGQSAWADELTTPAVEAAQPVAPIMLSVGEAISPEAAAGTPPTVLGATAKVPPERIPPAYLLPPARLAQADIDAFVADPLVFMNANPTGGVDMERQAQRLAASDNRTVAPLIALASRPEIRDVQLTAIARGLYSAANAAPSSAAEYAAYIQEAVLESGSVRIITAFQAVDPEETAALGSGGPDGGGAGGGGAGSLGGGGTAGFAGPSLGDAVVPQTSPSEGATSRGSVSFAESNEGSGGGSIIGQSVPSGGTSASNTPLIVVDLGGSGDGASRPGGGGRDVGVPFPVAGVGLPALLLAGAYAIVRRRRLKQSS